MRTWFLRLVTLACLAPAAWGYSFIVNGDGLAIKWPEGPINMRIQLGTPLHGDGSDFVAAAQGAMQDWNLKIQSVQLVPQGAGTGTAGDGNQANEIVFSASVFGEPFDENTLAVTTGWLDGGRRAEADILFNTAWTWSVYSGPLQLAEDFRRVALHELGHVLGLDHPDEAGQSVSALMNAFVSDLDTLTSDDIAGARALYGAPDTVPANDAFANATLVSGATAAVAGSNVGGTKEDGEPGHGGNDGGSSSWWKWVAPNNGSLTVTTLGSSFDTTLGIYTGSGVSALMTLASNDDVQSGVIRTSTATIEVANGTTYYFAVDGWDGDTGLIRLNLNFTPVVSLSAPTIIDQGASFAWAGEYSTLNAYASGNPTPVYQWQRLPAGSGSWIDLVDGDTVSGSQTGHLQLLTLATMDGDQFRCRVSNSQGVVFSTARTFSVAQSKALGWVRVDFPSGGAQGAPLSGSARVVNAGSTTWGMEDRLALLGPGDNEMGSVSLAGIAPGQAATVTINFVTPLTLGSTAYGVRPRSTGEAFLFTSHSFSFTISAPNTAPAILTQPVGRASSVGDNVSLSVFAVGQLPMAFQWRRNGDDILGATSATLALSNIQVGAAGDYTVRVSNALGSATSNIATVTVGVPSGISTVAAAGNYTLFLRSNGSRWGIGDGFQGQFGSGTVNSYSQPTQIDDEVALLAARQEGSAYVKTDGTLWITGREAGPPAGLGTTQQLSPVRVINGTEVVAVSMGAALYFIRADGTLWAAGNNSSGQLGDGTLVTRNEPVQIATEVAAVAAGNAHALFLKADGTVWGMGAGNFGMIGQGVFQDVQSQQNPTPVLIARNAKEVAAGINYSAVLKQDGTLWVTGFALPMVNSPDFVQIASNVRTIAAGGRHLLYVGTDSRLWAVGQNDKGQLGDGTFVDRATPVPVSSIAAGIAAGEKHSLFIDHQGTLWGAGLATSWQLGNTVGAYETNRWVAIASGDLVPPAAPGLVRASDGALAGAVRVIWTPAYGAFGYEILRNITNDSATATSLGRVRNQAIYYDASGIPGVAYYYWVRALSAQGAGGVSFANTGYSVAATPPGFLIQPGDYVYPLGSAPLPSFEAVATGNPAPTYRWQLKAPLAAGWSDISVSHSVFGGTLTPILQVLAGQFNSSFNGYRFRCVATNSAGSTISSEVLLSMVNGPTAPVITAHPQSKTVAQGEPAMFSVSTSGTAFYQWQRMASGSANWGNISTLEVLGGGSSTAAYSGQASATLTVTPTLAMNGDRFRCVVTNSGGSVFSNAAILGVRSGRLDVTKDYDGDGVADLLWRHLPTGLVASWTSGEGYRFFSYEDALWKVIGSGDYDGDGITDLLWRHVPSGLIASWTSVAGYRPFSYEDAIWQVIGSGDYDGDGIADLLWRHVPSGLVASWTSGAGYRPFSYEDAVWQVIDSGDYDGDGIADLLWRHVPSGLVASWTSGGGYRPFSYEDAIWQVIGSGDYDGDGTAELLWRHIPSGLVASWTSSAGYRPFSYEDAVWQVIH